ncbi:MAG: hypothetical protein ABSA77_09530 [Thermoguttaceae bacterium]|jgi:hypothetical protein
MKKLVVTVMPDKLNEVPISELVRRGWKLEIEERSNDRSEPETWIEITMTLGISSAIKEGVLDLLLKSTESYEWKDG